MTRTLVPLVCLLLAIPASASAQCDCPAENALVIGHRGAGSGTSDGLTENTVESAQAAFEAGAEMVEIDVQLTSDGALVLMHDETVDRTTDGTGCVADMTLAELQALDAGGVLVPTLDELFAATTGGVNVEVKVAAGGACPDTNLSTTAAAVAASITANAGARDVIVSSFSLEFLQTLRATESAIPIGYLSAAAADISTVQTEGFEAIHLLGAAATTRTVEQAHDASIRVNVWTINGSAEMERVFGLGVDGVITDSVDEAVVARLAVCEALVCDDAGDVGLDAGAGSVDAGSGSGGGGCGVAPGPGPGLPWLLVPLVVALRRWRS